MFPTVLILAATGFEPIELVTTCDILRRSGANVKVAAVGTESLAVRTSHSMIIHADAFFNDLEDHTYDLIVCPGGMPGTKNLASDVSVVEFIKRHYSAGKICAAICAAPGYVFAEACGILKGKRACGYPGTDQKIEENGGIITEMDVVKDGNIVTSRGPGTAVEFALTLVDILWGKEKRNEVARGLLYQPLNSL